MSLAHKCLPATPRFTSVLTSLGACALLVGVHACSDGESTGGEAQETVSGGDAPANGASGDALDQGSADEGSNATDEGSTESAAYETVPDGIGGVVVFFTQEDVVKCVPLCTVSTDPAADPEGDDWSNESDYSCVIPGSNTGFNQACVTGDALPDEVSVAGVVVVENSEASCVPLCVLIDDNANDPEQDGWSWENNKSCVIPGTTTASNQPCMTLEDIPPPLARPGVIVAENEVVDCKPVCQIVTEPSDAAASSDWGYEDNESCLLPDSPLGEGARECTFGEYPPDFIPPALTGTKVADGFYVQDGRVYDAYGADFVMRGINNAHIWYDGNARFAAWHALDDIAATGCNIVRIVWETDGDTVLLADILYRTVELGMVPMVELHDATGVVAAEPLLTIAEYYTRDDVVEVLNKFREYAMINIANEWSGGSADYEPTYITAVNMLRSAGLDHLIVIDASDYGQAARSVFNTADAITAADPLGNILFSVHMYDIYEEPQQVIDVLEEGVASSIPLIVGEFGHRLNGKDVAWQQLLATSQELSLGWIAWSWTGNDSVTEHLDMVVDWEGELTEWGNDIVNGDNGIAQTAQPASIFVP